MYNLNYLISLYMFIISCFMMFYYYKHLLMTLICMEFIMIMVIFNMYNILMYLEINLFWMIFLLSMLVCESALGLSLIIMMVRLYGNDYLNSLSMMKW